jgi:molybdopterin molybdotransferase
VREAIEILQAQPIHTTPTETVSIEKAYKRVLAEDIISPEELPGFARSSMDGFALSAEDTFGASESMPSYLRVVGNIKMGEKPTFKINRGEAATVATGGMLPEGADAVLMLEHTNRVDAETIEVLKQVAPGENVIGPDEDIKKGEKILQKGHRLRSQDIGALAGIGILQVRVYKRPVVAIISTGDEIVPPQKKPLPGQVRDINSYNLVGLIEDAGGIGVKKGIIRDNREELKNALLEAASTSDMVLITGGSSVGTGDYTEEVINDLGSPGVLFHGVMMKPGKPLIGAFMDKVAVFGLPGHPAAVTVCFEVFVKPLLRKISGEKVPPYIPEKKTVKAYLSRNLSSTLGREDYIRVNLREKDGRLVAEPILGKSALIRTLVYADGMVVIPKDSNGIYEGQEVEVMLFED